MIKISQYNLDKFTIELATQIFAMSAAKANLADRDSTSTECIRDAEAHTKNLIKRKLIAIDETSTQVLNPVRNIEI